MVAKAWVSSFTTPLLRRQDFISLDGPFETLECERGKLPRFEQRVDDGKDIPVDENLAGFRFVTEP